MSLPSQREPNYLLKFITALIVLALVGIVYGIYRYDKAKEEKRKQDAVSLVEEAYARENLIFSEMKIEKIADDGPIYAISVKATNKGNKNIKGIMVTYDLPKEWVVYHEEGGASILIFNDLCSPIFTGGHFVNRDNCFKPGQSILLGGAFDITYYGADRKAPVLMPEYAKLFNVSVFLE